MGVLWFVRGGSSGWGARLLGRGPLSVVLDRDEILFRAVDPAGEADAALPVFVQEQRGASGGRCALLSSPGQAVLVGGRAIPGMRVLEDRDEIRIGPHWLFYSSETIARVENYRGADVVCPRCRLPVQAGMAIVACPGCGVIHHAAADRDCWAYAPLCAACADQPTSERELRWTPEGL
jgi:hypothetical protein